ncbi:MAG: xanthine dehydrogenase small subunit [Betaproteobacteria bacterium]|nr:MAG: xanthine dehydrogenase small subunit [Betaproteobacteria bacterium]
MRHSIEFLLNGERIAVDDLDPHTTVLQFLRERRGLTGTKEGCAEGDCGACTVAIAELSADQRVDVKPINACIRLLATIDGKALFTVEALSNANSRAPLHPVQAAMVDAHASQCGFCTPGFVMSLFALFKNECSPSRDRVIEAISGNLCRCTGYRPIIEAGIKATTAICFSTERGESKEKLEANSNGNQALAPTNSQVNGESQKIVWLNTPGRSEALESAERAMIEALAALPANASSESLHYRFGGQQFFAPRSIDELSSLVADHPNAWILAGGTDIGLWITKALQHNATLIYTGGVRALRDIRESDAALEIGAAVPLEDAFHAMNRHYPELAQVWTRFASWPIRSSGTLGGNVANGSPIGDSMPALIALGATVSLRHRERVRTIPLEALYLDYKKQSRAGGEWIEKITIPRRIPNVQIGFYKNSKRNEQDISAVCAAISMVIDRGVVQYVRIAYGGMAGVPKRAINAETELTEKAWSETQVRAAMQAMHADFSPMSDMRASAAYRMQVAQNLLLRFWLESQSAPAEVRVI